MTHANANGEGQRVFFSSFQNYLFPYCQKSFALVFLFNCFSVLSVLYWIIFFYLNTNQRKSLKFIQLSAFIEYNEHEICNPMKLSIGNMKKIKKKNLKKRNEKNLKQIIVTINEGKQQNIIYITDIFFKVPS